MNHDEGRRAGEAKSTKANPYTKSATRDAWLGGYREGAGFEQEATP